MESANEVNKKRHAVKNIDESKKTENKEKAVINYCAENKTGEIVEKLFKYITNNQFELCICFDDSFKYKDKLIEAFSVLEEFKVRLAVMTWSSSTDVKYFDFKTVNKQFKYSENLLDNTIRQIYDVRKCIVKLNWSKHGTLKALLYIFSKYDRYSYKVYNYTIDQEIYSTGINKIQICIEDIACKIKNVEFFKKLIKNKLKHIEDFIISGHLINLKRCLVFDEATLNRFINKSIQKKTNKTYQEINIETKYLKMKLSINDWREQLVLNSQQHSSIEQVKLYDINHENILNASDFSSNFMANTRKYWYIPLIESLFFLYSTVQLRIENIFLDENVNNEQINHPYFNLINIHLTTSLLASKFNERSTVKIMLPAAYLFKSLIDENYKFVREDQFFSNNDMTNVLKEDERAIFSMFSHFTYKYTNKKLMVIGLRGYYSSYNQKLNLDEAAIFSSGQTQKYGASDLGDFGIQRFFDNHVCTMQCMQ